LGTTLDLCLFWGTPTCGLSGDDL